VKDTPPLLFWITLPLHHRGTTAVLFARHATRGEAGVALARFRRRPEGHPSTAH
jgi:hypothetical protein